MGIQWTSRILGVVLCGLCCIVDAADWPSFPLIHVVGEAKIDIAPDVAKISFGTLAFDKDPAVALRQLQKTSADVLKVARGFSVDSGDVLAYELSKRVVRAENDYKQLDILGYEATRQFEITIHDMDKYSPLVDALVAMPHVANMSSSFDVSKRGAIESELSQKAVKNAWERAQGLAEGAQAKLGAVFAVSEQRFSEIAGQYGHSASFDPMFEKAMRGGEDEPMLVPKTISLEKRVYVIFRLADPQ